jgi:YqjK-like protein
MTDADYRLLLAARRELLVRRAERERLQFARSVEPLARSWVWVERGFGVWRTVRGHPWLVLTPLAVLLLWRPRVVLRAAASALTLWRVGRSAQRALHATRGV